MLNVRCRRSLKTRPLALFEDRPPDQDRMGDSRPWCPRVGARPVSGTGRGEDDDERGALTTRATDAQRITVIARVRQASRSDRAQCSPQPRRAVLSGLRRGGTECDEPGDHAAMALFPLR